MGVMDLRVKISSSKAMISESENHRKFCSDCKTTKTPLWRGGPAGPKSLCNACGIKYRKKRRAMLGLNKDSEKKKKERCHSSHSTVAAASETVKMKLYNLGSEVFLRTSPSSSRSSATAFSSSSSSIKSGFVMKKQRCQRRRKLGEEEQAAFCLMALSCGSVLA